MPSEEKIDSKMIEFEKDIMQKRRKLYTFVKTDENGKYLDFVIPITPELNISEEINLIGKPTTLENKEAILRNQYINYLCRGIPKIDTDIDVIVNRLVEEIKSLPDGTETSISSLLATIYGGIPRHGADNMYIEFDLSDKELFEINKKVSEKAAAVGLYLDFSKYEDQKVGFPFNIPFVKRTNFENPEDIKKEIEQLKIQLKGLAPKKEKMTEQEYREKAKKLGYSEEEIQEEINVHNALKEKGMLLPFEDCLIVKPVYENSKIKRLTRQEIDELFEKDSEGRYVSLVIPSVQDNYPELSLIGKRDRELILEEVLRLKQYVALLNKNRIESNSLPDKIDN